MVCLYCSFNRTSAKIALPLGQTSVTDQVAERIREDIPVTEKSKEITVNFRQNKRCGDEDQFFRKEK